MTIHTSSHSFISKFKNKSKLLKKSSNLSLIQSQTVIIQKNNYNNLHDFLQKLKKTFTKTKRYKHLSELDKVTSHHIDCPPENGFYHIGKETEKSLEYWLSWKQSHSHICIIEEYSSIYSLDMYISKQAIINKQPVIFSSSNTEETKILLNFARSNGRKNIYLFDIANQIQNEEQYKKFKLSLNYIDNFLSSFLYEYVIDENMGADDKNQLIQFIQLVSSITTYQKEIEHIDIDINILLKNGTLEQFKKYQTILPNYQVQILEQEIKTKIMLEETYRKIIDKIKATNLFNENSNKYDINYKNEITFDHLYLKEDEPPIFIFLSNKNELPEHIKSNEFNNYEDLINLTVFNYYNKILGSSFSSLMENKNDSIAFIMRNPPIFFKYGVLPAFNRSIHSSFILTFNKLPNSFPIHLKSLFANLDNCFFGRYTSHIEDNYSVKDLFNIKLNDYLTNQTYQTYQTYHSYHSCLGTAYYEAYYKNKINCKYRDDQIESLLLNEYIFFYKNQISKIKM